MSERKFDISWATPPRRGDADSPSPMINPFPPPLVSSDSLPRDVEDLGRARRLPERDLDQRLLQALAEGSGLHIVDLAAQAGVEFEDALRSILRLVARREVTIEQRDPVANDHLVAVRRLPAHS